MSKSKRSGLAGSLILDQPQKSDTHSTEKQIAQKPKPVAKSVQEDARTPVQVNGRAGVHKNGRTRVQANPRTGGRVIKRHPFNFYQDQIDQLNWLQLKKKMQGNTEFSMSQLVREAVDYSLKKLKAKGEFDEYPNG